MDPKKVVSTFSDHFSMLLLADSHASLIGQDLAREGTNTVALRGGKVGHGRKYLEQNQFFGGKLTHLFLLLGGNDCDNNCPTQVVAALEQLIYDVVKFNRQLVVVTGTFIPRRGSWGGENGFIQRVWKVDELIKKCGQNHHHYVTDVFFDDCGEGGIAKLRSELYTWDSTHLNGKGRTIFLDLLRFLIEAANRQDFTGQYVWGYKESQRRAMWKF